MKENISLSEEQVGTMFVSTMLINEWELSFGIFVIELAS